MERSDIFPKRVSKKMENLRTIEKTVKISKDSKNLLLRIPKLVEEALEIKKGETITFKVLDKQLILIFRGKEFADKELPKKKE